MNDSGEKLLQFCNTNDLMIIITFFKPKRPQRKCTSLDGGTHNLIGSIIINKRWSSYVTNCRSFDAQIGSDHTLVIANLNREVDAFRPKGHEFDCRSSRHVGTLGKSFTHSCLWRFGVKFQHSSLVDLKTRYRNSLNENIKYDTKKLADYNIRQKYGDREEHTDHVVKHTKRNTNSCQQHNLKILHETERPLNVRGIRNLIETS